MFDWIFNLFSAAEPLVTIQLISDYNTPGFRNGSLTLTARTGTTFGNLLENFNMYRGPDSQISNLYDRDGNVIPRGTIITAPAICMVRKI